MVKSPCINVCRMHAELGVCRGCYRTLEEIGDWSTLPDTEKRRVAQEAEARRAKIGPLEIV
ncbi:MAG: DUF1289 domain-containing protein [Betaproteobacteria bacterium]|nr:DUF1289 domain-containing protein [Betaproteobacteria bacterium]